MERLIVLAVLTAVAVGVALLLQRRRPDPPSAPSYRAPTQVDRADFEGSPDHPIITVFTSATCSSCAVALESANNVVAGQRAADVGLTVQDIEVTRDAKLHSRYRIDGVPTTLIVDRDGVVQKTFFGPTTPEELETVLFGESDPAPDGAGSDGDPD